ncbi:PREDICTED: uncharacterized protein LOC106148328 [Chinchilla lanigera]|uniref:uncharacterized protein LOC106148328 n=1 Tax=Chinchilla lanigera TaxID=34839 RepID=UPI000698313A|nr:PREDICTED: uncharacterized protein LOC106148328 [Chinchilla lanigera]
MQRGLGGDGTLCIKHPTQITPPGAEHSSLRALGFAARLICLLKAQVATELWNSFRGLLGAHFPSEEPNQASWGSSSKLCRQAGGDGAARGPSGARQLFRKLCLASALAATHHDAQRYDFRDPPLRGQSEGTHVQGGRSRGWSHWSHWSHSLTLVKGVQLFEPFWLCDPLPLDQGSGWPTTACRPSRPCLLLQAVSAGHSAATGTSQLLSSGRGRGEQPRQRAWCPNLEPLLSDL